MDYTLENLINILRRRLQDEEFDGDTLTIFLNDSLNEILGEDKYPFMQQIDQYSAEEAGEISLPPFYAGTFYIYGKKSDEDDKNLRKELTYISPEEYFNKPAARSFVYTVFANTLFYRLEKGADTTDYEIIHLYLKNPIPLKKPTDRPQLPPQYMETLILGALARAEEIRDNFDYAQLFRNQQDQLLTNMKLRYGPGNLTAQNRARLPHFFGGNYYGDI